MPDPQRPHGPQPSKLLHPWDFQGKYTGVRCHCLLRNAVLGCNLRSNRMISVHFQGKPFIITVIQVCAPKTNAEEAEVEWIYEDLQDLLELTPPKRCPFHHRGLECKSRKSRNNWFSSFQFSRSVVSDSL